MLGWIGDSILCHSTSERLIEAGLNCNANCAAVRDRESRALGAPLFRHIEVAFDGDRRRPAGVRFDRDLSLDLELLRRIASRLAGQADRKYAALGTVDAFDFDKRQGCVLNRFHTNRATKDLRRHRWRQDKALVDGHGPAVEELGDLVPLADPTHCGFNDPQFLRRWLVPADIRDL